MVVVAREGERSKAKQMKRNAAFFTKSFFPFIPLSPRAHCKKGEENFHENIFDIDD